MSTATAHPDQPTTHPIPETGAAVFEQPWQAQAFALIVHLHQAGFFPWADWVQTFSDVITTAPARPDESINDAYYRQWIAGMEQMVARLGLTEVESITHRTDEWRQAYLNTPHGEPVALTHASCPPKHRHHAHSPNRSPVAVSEALTNQPT
ncbi:nitrile hydratase accessory protein [Burkholderia pyrrocinia]|uniref:nitrile hydratase accessory protein n=1 Tax=Burkholderia pyrrocinia TaxID=60550 RepID=UPI002AAF22BD|nr:nitrile hydratase accessory protein [Burkholderia pyrrocinia]